MTDLKTANEQLAQALKALESAEHDTDVREAEACRNRLMELDERIGARIKAKLRAHKAIADCWGEKPANPELDAAVSRLAALASTPEAWDYIQGSVSPPAEQATVSPQVWNAAPPVTDGLTAEAWQAHHEEHTGKYALAGEEVPDRVMVNGVAEMQQADD